VNGGHSPQSVRDSPLPCRMVTVSSPMLSWIPAGCSAVVPISDCRIGPLSPNVQDAPGPQRPAANCTISRVESAAFV
jgi:hypothetical protein